MNEHAAKAKKSPPMHFYVKVGETLCGKSVSHTRSTSLFTNWDNPLLAAGRRCATCAAGVVTLRKDSKP